MDFKLESLKEKELFMEKCQELCIFDQFLCVLKDLLDHSYSHRDKRFVLEEESFCIILEGIRIDHAYVDSVNIDKISVIKVKV